MIDFGREELIPLREASKFFPRRRNGKMVSRETLYRWTNSGCHGVKLAYVQSGGARYTSRESVERFVAEMTAKVQAARQNDKPVVRPSRSDARLKAAGL